MTDEATPKKPSKSKKAAKEGASWAPVEAPRTDARLPASFDERTNQRDAQGRLDGLWVMMDHQKNTVVRRYRAGWMDGASRTYAPSGALLLECAFAPAHDWYPDGPKSEHAGKHLDDGRFLYLQMGSRSVGDERTYFESGQCERSRSLDEGGFAHGVERRWDRSGALLEEQHWEHGVRVGVGRKRNDKGGYDETVYEGGLPQLAPRALKSLIGKLAKCKDDQSKAERELHACVPYELAHVFAWSLARRGLWDPNDGGWAGLSVLAAGGIGDRDVALRVIEAACARPKLSDQWNFLPQWPHSLDGVMRRSYRREDDALWRDLAGRIPVEQRAGVHFVRARMGATLTESERAEVLSLLARGFVKGDSGFSVEVPIVHHDGTASRSPHQRPSAALDLYVSLLADEAAFAPHLLSALRAIEYVYFTDATPVFKRLAPAELGMVIAKYDKPAGQSVPALAPLSHCTVADWALIAERLLQGLTEGDWRRRRMADAVFVWASRAAAREGVALPPSFDALVTLDSIEWSPGAAALLDGATPLIEALSTLPAERVHGIARRALERPYFEERAALLLGVAPSPELLGKLVSRARVKAGATSHAKELKHYAIALGALGAAGLDAFEALYEEPQASPMLRSLAWRAVLVMLSRCSAPFDRRFDRFIDVQQPNDERADKYDLEWLFVPCSAAAVRALPEARAEAVILRNLVARSSQWTAALSLVAAAPTEAVVDRLVSVFAAKALELDAWDRNLVAMIKALGDARVAVLSRVLLGAGDARRHVRSVLSHHLSPAELSALDQSAPAAVERDESLAALASRVQSMSDRLSLEKVSVYLLAASEHEASATDVGRLGGSAIGVDASRWPRHRKSEMEHVLTLDLDAMPDVRARRGYGPEVRAVALFVPNRETGDALDKGAVLTITDEQLASGENDTMVLEGERATRMEVVCVTVPRLVFLDPRSGYSELDPEVEGAVRALRKAVASAHGRVLGLPFYIQSSPDEHDDGGEPGQFLAQFDERLVNINTGDMGLIYMFTGGVFMQCH